MKLESLAVVSRKDKEQRFYEVCDLGKKMSIQCISLQRILQRLTGDAHLKGKTVIKKVNFGPRI